MLIIYIKTLPKEYIFWLTAEFILKKTYSTSDGSLTVKYVGETHGRDNNGHYNETNFEFNAKDDEKIGMHAFIRVYKAGFAVFRQHFFPVFSGMSVGDKDKVSTSFPSIKGAVKKFIKNLRI